MTVYSELLRDRLQAGAGTEERSASDLLAELVGRRSLESAVTDSGASAALLDNLDYDAALVRLCRRLGVGQQLTDPFPPPDARRQAEEALAARLPGLAGAG
ncbi:MAG TPA: hypothetical protein VGR90_10530 [Acidimicrobiales bacterium]|nr:hypothetical protein [Acidimicrobiales bacterium]